MEFIIGIIGKLVLGALDFWIKKTAKDDEMIKSYYEFLKMVDKSGTVRVDQLLKAEDALKAKQDELRKALENEANDTKPKDD